MKSIQYVRIGLLASTCLVPFAIASANAAETPKPAGAQIVPSAQSDVSKAKQDDSSKVEEIVVTATRRAESLSKVPISVAAFTSERMDQQGIRSIDDIAQFTPGITFSRTDNRNAGASAISIRGISSTVAASTTGIYLNDTPIQTRIIGAGAANFSTYPAVFDLERVEVLRGPQGTLFGAGSEGGTLRFITPKPSLTDYSVYARGETAFTESGGPSYEAGVAVGGPIVADKLGFRITGWSRRDGGYIDRVNTDPQPGDTPLAVFNADPSTPATVIPHRDHANFVTEQNSNWKDSRVLNGSFALQPVDNLVITAGVYYQKIYNNDANTYWEALSKPDKGVWQQGYPLRQPNTDEFWLPSVSINWDLGPVRFITNSSYMDRNQNALNDYAPFESALWAGYWEFPVGMFAPTVQSNSQVQWTQEARLESTNDNSWFRWVIGAFYQKTTEKSRELVQDTFLPNLFFDVVGVPFSVALPCPTCAANGLALGKYTFNQDPVLAHDEQTAGFAQFDIKPIDNLTVTLGVRYGQTKFDANAHYYGPVVGPVVNDTGNKTEYPLTPKFGLSYQLTPGNMIYASAAKGFRVGGYNPQVGLPCTALVGSFGYSASAGNPTGRPQTFSSDSLWSYEVGSKNSFFGGRAQINGSAYYIDWKNIQQNVALASCGFAFTINAGKAISQGFDLDATFRLTDQLSVGGSAGYNDAEFQKTVFGGPTALVPLVSKGDKLPGSPWTLTLNSQYNFNLFERDLYVRFDYEYHSQGPDNTAALDLKNRSPVLPPADPLVFQPTPEMNLLSARAGIKIEGADVSIFVKNLLDEHPNLARTDLNIKSNPLDTHGYTGLTLIPRTWGATISYRY